MAPVGAATLNAVVLPKSTQANSSKEVNLNLSILTRPCIVSSNPTTVTSTIPNMKQNLSDAQSKGSHLPSQINLLTSSMKAKSGAEAGACEPGSYVDGSAEVSSLGQTELRHRHGSQGAIPANQTQQHLTAPNSGTVDAHKTSINSIDLVDVIEAQQQSLHELASQYNGSNQPQMTPTKGVTCSAPSTNGCQQLKSDFCDNLSVSPEVKKKDLVTTVVQMTTKNGLSNGTGAGDGGGHESSTEKTVTSSSCGDEDDKEKWSNIRRLLAGVSLTILSALCFSITTVIVKFVTDIKPSQMALYRYLGILVLSFPVMLESKESWFGENNWWWRLWMLLRGLSGCTSLFFRYSSVTYISLADTTIILLSMPVFVFIFARIFLGEQFGRFHVLALVLSIVGIAFASKIEFLFGTAEKALNSTMIPESLFNSTTTTTMTTTTLASTTVASNVVHNGATSSYNQLIGSLYACGAMVVGSLVYVMVRKMRKTHHSVILFNFALISIFEMTAINFIFYDFKLPTTGYSAYLITILAVFSFYGQLLLTKAIQIEEAGVVSVVRVSGEAFFAFLFQIIIFGEMPDLYTILGAILVLSSVFLLSFRKYILSLPEGASLRHKFRFLAI